jgi:hypothetical protein
MKTPQIFSDASPASPWHLDLLRTSHEHVGGTDRTRYMGFARQLLQSAAQNRRSATSPPDSPLRVPSLCASEIYSFNLDSALDSLKWYARYEPRVPDK